MMLTDEKSLCKRHQKIIVSRDKGNKREHRTINRDGIYKVRQYKLDGDIFNNVKCCDYLILNDTEGNEKAIYIELKGGNVDEAISGCFCCLLPPGRPWGLSLTTIFRFGLVRR